VQVVREAYPDLTAQDKSSKYHDPKASPGDPRWSMVDFKLVSGSPQLLLQCVDCCCDDHSTSTCGGLLVVAAVCDLVLLECV
jgi:predicted RNA-binding protein with PUA-like domain